MSSLKANAIQAYLGSAGLRRAWHRGKRVLRRAPRTLVYYHQVDDPHSHLLAQGLLATTPPDVQVELVVVPSPAADVDPEPQLRAAYGRKDAARLARLFGLSMPERPADPALGETEETKALRAERRRRANAVLLVPRQGHGALQVAIEVGEALLADEPHALSRAVKAYGVVGGQEVRPRLEANYARLRRAGHYQGGVVQYDGEWYLGLDRLHHLRARMEAEGQASMGASFQYAGPPIAHADTMFFSFRSPYSYLAMAQLSAWPRLPRLRAVLPMVMRGLAVPRIKVFAIAIDAKREANALGIPFGKAADPLGEGVERALAGFYYADAHGQGHAYALRVMRGIWSEGLDLKTPKARLQVALDVGLDGDAIEQSFAAGTWRTLAEDARQALHQTGQWGVPTFVCGEEVFWGQDRLRWLGPPTTG